MHHLHKEEENEVMCRICHGDETDGKLITGACGEAANPNPNSRRHLSSSALFLSPRRLYRLHGSCARRMLDHLG